MKTELNFINHSSFDDLTPSDFIDDAQDRQANYVDDLNQERAIIINRSDRCYY